MDVRPGTIPLPKLISRLWELGFLPQYDTVKVALKHTTGQELMLAVLAYKGLHGLPMTPEPDAEMEASLDQPRFCLQPDVMPMQSTLCKWPSKEVSFGVDAVDWPGVGLASAKESAVRAASEWNRVCGINLSYSSNPKTANIPMRSGKIDGPSGTLAWSELPCSQGVTVCNELYDQAEQWDVQITLWIVMLHEMGHAIGLPHISRGNVLAPTYNPSLQTLQAGDIKEAVARYGPPSGGTTPPPTTPPPQWALEFVPSDFTAVGLAKAQRLRWLP